MSKQATFTEMLNGTAEDYAIIGRETSEYAKSLPDRILEHLSILKGDTGGFAVDRFTHCLQTATRAYKDGRDEEYVVALYFTILEILWLLQIMLTLLQQCCNRLFRKKITG